jgi:hypothetical protein
MECTVHGSKRWVRVPRILYIEGSRFKRSRHKTLADRIRRRRYRAQMRNLLRNGNGELLHNPPRDASWYW